MQRMQFVYYRTLPEVLSRNNGWGPTEKELQSVFPLARYYDDGLPWKIEVPNAFLPETKTRYFCKLVPSPPLKFEFVVNETPGSNNTGLVVTEKKMPLLIQIPGTTGNAATVYASPI